MEKYLDLAMVKGIDPIFAKQLIQYFGANIFDIIEQNPDKLLEVEGIGKNDRKKFVLPEWNKKWSEKLCFSYNLIG
ncbi:MAG: helix-hairpin-helix domain-containing protein [Arsenophonus sp. NC-PG7-MAG3]